MKLILSLLKKILVSLSDFYRKDYVNAELDKRVDSTVFTSSLGDETAERKRVDLEISASIDDNEANDEALAKVIEWQGYVDQICRSVDDDVAIAFAEEFEKAAVEYLADPTATKNWVTNSATESTSPYFSVAPTRPVVDFSVNSATGGYGKGAFYPSTNVPVFLPNATIVLAMLSTVSGFNQPLILPIATNCQYLLNYAGTFNQTLNLPLATNCSRMLLYAKAFNQPLNLPSATNCSYMLYQAKAFNQPLSLPAATNCDQLLYGATAFNQPLSIPNAVACWRLVSDCKDFNQFVYLPKCSDGNMAFVNTSMSAENIAKTLDSLPKWEGGTHKISFMDSPGIKSVSTTESFTVTDEDGIEYTLDNSPIFINDDDDQTLRKSVTLAVMKKGWTVEGGGDYTQVSYLGLTGTQYIDTGIVGDLDTSYEIVFDTDKSSTHYLVLFGTRESATSRSISTVVYLGGGSLLIDFGDYLVTRQEYTAFKRTVRYKVYNSKNNRSVYDYETDQTVSVATSYTSSFTTPTNLFIGYKSSGYPENMINFSGRVYSCKIWQAGVLVRDLIPVVDTNGVASMYDKVSRTVLPNAGTGAFEYEDSQST